MHLFSLSLPELDDKSSYTLMSVRPKETRSAYQHLKSSLIKFNLPGFLSSGNQWGVRDENAYMISQQPP